MKSKWHWASAIPLCCRVRACAPPAFFSLLIHDLLTYYRRCVECTVALRPDGAAGELFGNLTIAARKKARCQRKGFITGYGAPPENVICGVKPAEFRTTSTRAPGRAASRSQNATHKQQSVVSRRKGEKPERSELRPGLPLSGDRSYEDQTRPTRPSRHRR